MNRRRQVVGWVVVVMLALPLLGACGRTSGGKGEVIASFYPLAYFAAQIAGDRATVRSLVPAGTEPHEWEPSAKNIADMQHSTVFIYNGAGFEPWVPKALESTKPGRPIVVEAAAGLTLLSPPTKAAATESATDPHVWLDPILAKQIARTIAKSLIQADPDGKEVYERNLALLNGQLDDLDGKFNAGLRDCTRREIVTAHAAFGYLARRYGLEQIAVEGLSPDAEPTPARIAEVTRLARERGATHIYFETLVNPGVAEAIAREIGATTLVLDPLEGVKDERTQTYFTVMMMNLANLRTGLGCH